MDDIKTLRQSAGLTQQQLADLARLNIRQIQKIESGEIKPTNLTARTWLSLCRVLDLDPWQILAE